MWRISCKARQAAVINGQQQPAPARQEKGQRRQDTSSSQQSRRVPAGARPAAMPAADRNNGQQNQQSANVAGPATPDRSSYAAAVAGAATTETAVSLRKPPPATTPTGVAGAAQAAAVQTTAVFASKASQQPVISPKLTWARKKKRCLSDVEAFDQLDGAATSPPPSPDKTTFKELDGDRGVEISRGGATSLNRWDKTTRGTSSPTTTTTLVEVFAPVSGTSNLQILPERVTWPALYVLQPLL